MELGRKLCWKIILFCSSNFSFQKVRCISLVSLLLSPFTLVLTLPSETSTPSPERQLALNHFNQAVQMRTALEAKPKRLRTAVEYLKVIEKFRSVYHTCPASSKVDEAFLAIAELYQSMANDFKNPKYYYQAIKAYTFLEKEYPSSPHCAEALFASAEIYLNDLHDQNTAQEIFKSFLKKYPDSSKARSVRARLLDLREQSRQPKKLGPKVPSNHIDSASEGKVNSLASKPDQNSHSMIPGASKLDLPSQAKSSSPITVTPRKTEKPVLVKDIRFWNLKEYTRLVIDLDNKATYVKGKLDNPARIFLDFENAKLSSLLIGQTFSLQGGYLRRVRFGQVKEDVARIVLDVSEIKDYYVFNLNDPFRIVVDIQGPAKAAGQPTHVDGPKKEGWLKRGEPLPDELTIVSPLETSGIGIAKKEPSTETQVARSRFDLSSQGASSETAPDRTKGRLETLSKNKEPAKKPIKAEIPHKEVESVVSSGIARPKSDGTRSLIRTLGLKIGRIVIDPGHGGHDTGTIGPSGLREKDLVLDISLKLKTLIEERLGGEVILTREDDTFIPLEFRTEIANATEADLFISIHANSSPSRRVSGVETFFLNFATSSDLEDLAARENAGSQKTVFELQDLITKIALKEKLDESKEFAQIIQRSMTHHLQKTYSRTVDRGVKQAPFIVLIGANMPSILTEVSFVSNPSDEKLLKSLSYRQKVAEALCNGIEHYIKNLGGLKTARNIH